MLQVKKIYSEAVCKKLKLYPVVSYVAGAGVSEPGLNRRPDKDCLRYGGGLKILWRRPSWVQVPPPAPRNLSFHENHVVQAAEMFVSSDNFPFQTSRSAQ